eukprot:TRINITY_DN5136_c0_g2_i1.p1 TRINITY_DN5136_c0_g2~~TRINITY_DN5136_c0_g2_i1.p1  ORF type:complete len:341 (-),score=82.00 TRINITY_DN5136_c0_g2_i1:1320-2342(-)
MAPPGVNGAGAKKGIDQNDGGKPLQVDAEPADDFARLEPSRTAIHESWPSGGSRATPSQQPRPHGSLQLTATLSSTAHDEVEDASERAAAGAEAEVDHFPWSTDDDEAGVTERSDGVEQVLKVAKGRFQVDSDGDDSTSEEEAGSVHSVDADEVDKVLPSEPAYSAIDDLELLPLRPEDFPGVDVTAPVQAHEFNQQIPRAKMNLALGLCFGHAAETGDRRTMEDRTTAIADLFASDHQQRSSRGSSTAPPPPSPLPPVNAVGLPSAAESPLIAQSMPASQGQCSEPLGNGVSGSATEAMPLPVAYFGVYDGHGGCEVAEALEKDLHRLIVKNGLQGDPV